MFTLICNDNGELTNVTAEQSGRAIAVTVSTGAVLPARNLNDAIKKAAGVVGPLLEHARRGQWGLYVSAGDVSALFGEFPPGPAAPVISGPPARPSSEVARIHDQWARRDGTAEGALDAAIKIIRIYGERPARGQAA